MFEARASVIVSAETPQVLGAQVDEVVETAPKHAWNKKDYMSTQIGILTSMRVVEKVVRKLGLHRNKSFLKPVKDPKRKGKVSDFKRAANQLQGIITPSVRKNSDILYIEIRHSDPTLTALIANTLASTFIEQNLDLSAASTEALPMSPV